jgi:hypothetical protein
MANIELSLAGAAEGTYELNVVSQTGNGTARIYLSTYIVDGPFPGGLTSDQVADGFRDWVASLPNYKSSTLEKVEVARTLL